MHKTGAFCVGFRWLFDAYFRVSDGADWLSWRVGWMRVTKNPDPLLTDAHEGFGLSFFGGPPTQPHRLETLEGGRRSCLIVLTDPMRLSASGFCCREGRLFQGWFSFGCYLHGTVRDWGNNSQRWFLMDGPSQPLRHGLHISCGCCFVDLSLKVQVVAGLNRLNTHWG